jgi:hypothetical protein
LAPALVSPLNQRKPRLARGSCKTVVETFSPQRKQRAREGAARIGYFAYAASHQAARNEAINPFAGKQINAAGHARETRTARLQQRLCRPAPPVP